MALHIPPNECLASATYTTCTKVAIIYMLLANTIQARQVYSASAIKSGCVCTVSWLVRR